MSAAQLECAMQLMPDQPHLMSVIAYMLYIVTHTSVCIENKPSKVAWLSCHLTQKHIQYRWERNRFDCPFYRAKKGAIQVEYL